MTTLESGAVLGHYRILSLLGRGGMADVYRAKDERLEREVALKVLPAEFARDRDRVARFESEVRSAAGLSHPNIVPVFEYAEAERQPFYSMALAPGGDLKERIRARPGGIPPKEALELAAALARALDHAHERGLVHRDVKPENVLFAADGTPQLTDFGIVRAAGGGSGMTAAGVSVGSPHYMSPEQARGQEVDGRSDLYSLGVVLYEMLTGQTPFDGTDTMAVAYAQVFKPAPSLPAALARHQPLLDRLLAKPPEDRYGSASEVAAVCARAAESEAGSSSASAPRGADAAGATRLMDAIKGEGAGGGKGEDSSPWSQLTRRQLHFALAGFGTVAALVLVAGILAMRGSPDSGNRGGDGPAARLVDRNLPRPEEPASPSAAALPVRVPTDSPESPDPPVPPGPPVPSDPPPAQPVTGGLAAFVVTTEPAGARVLVDGESVGTTPLERSDLRAGVRELTLRHRFHRTVRIADQRLEDGTTLRVHRSLPRGVGRLTVVATPPEAWVEVNGERMAEATPVTLDDVPAGPVTVRVGAADYQETEIDDEIRHNGHLRLERELEPVPYGTLTLDVTPALAVVHSADLPLGWQSGMALPPGTYRIEVSAPGYRDYRLTVAHARSPTIQAVALEPVALASFRRFHAIRHDLSEVEDHDAECKEGLGDGVRLADWDDIIRYYRGGGSHQDFVAGLRMAVEGREPDPGELTDRFRVSSGGRFLWGPGRHFFVIRHDGRKPAHFFEHDEVGGHLLSLGSWSGTGGFALCFGERP